MVSVGLVVRMEARRGKEAAVEAFLKKALQLANAEATTPLWCTLKLGPSTFVVFDAFRDEAGRQTHLNGPIAEALGKNAAELFAEPPSIQPTEILGTKFASELAA